MMNSHKQPVVKLAGCLIAVILAAISSGCQKKTDPPSSDAGLTTEQIIRKYSTVPMGDSIGPVAKSLAAGSMFAGTVAEASADPQHVQLATAKDAQGRSWIYAFSSQAEFSKVYPQGGPFVEMSFADLIKTVEANPEFAGVYINSASQDAYPIPKELFGRAKDALR